MSDTSNLHCITNTMKTPKTNYSITFQNTDGEAIGKLDFNGPGLEFEGNAEMSAIIFVDWVAKTWSGRLKEEYERGLKDAQSSQAPG
jgi:hypothetical protein